MLYTVVMLTEKMLRLGETVLVMCIVIYLVMSWLQWTEEATAKSMQAGTKTQVATIARALNLYRIDEGEYPPVVGGHSFCKPFSEYAGTRCLGELMGDYLGADSVELGENNYVYTNQSDSVFIAADIPVGIDTRKSNRCMVNTLEFWCVKLPK